MLHHYELNHPVNPSKYDAEAVYEDDPEEEVIVTNESLGAVCPEGRYRFTYSYPFFITFTADHTLGPESTLDDVMACATKNYKRIYNEDLEGEGNVIWGYDIDDLFFEGVSIDAELKTVTFEIGS